MSSTPHLDAWREAEGRRNRPPRPPEPSSEEPLGTLYHRRQQRVPTPGSQRRCYNGCFPSSDWEILWGPWEVLRTSCPESVLDFWINLSRDSVSLDDGGSGHTEYKWERNPQ